MHTRGVGDCTVMERWVGLLILQLLSHFLFSFSVSLWHLYFTNWYIVFFSCQAFTYSVSSTTWFLLQVILTTLLKAYVRGGLFGKSREILTELEALGYAKDEVRLIPLSRALHSESYFHYVRENFLVDC